MAYKEILESITLLAGADLSGSQFLLVKLTASGTVGLCDAVTDHAIGILQNVPESGQEATVGVKGVSKFRPGSDISYGDYIAPDASAQGIPTMTAAHFAIGTATEDHDVAATPTGSELASVLLMGPFHPAVS